MLWDLCVYFLPWIWPCSQTQAFGGKLDLLDAGDGGGGLSCMEAEEATGWDGGA